MFTDDGISCDVPLSTARLYLVSGARPGGRPLADVLPRALAGGVDLFQLREKDAPDEVVLREAERARAICADAGVPFLLNDRPDLARLADADGVHVGQDDEPVAAAREAVGADRIVGLSTHAPEQLAARDGADYVAVGPVHATPTKPGRPAAGIGYVSHAARAGVDVPWFAIGGIDADTLPAVLDAGARRVVVVRAITEAADPEAAARTLRRLLDGAA